MNSTTEISQKPSLLEDILYNIFRVFFFTFAIVLATNFLRFGNDWLGKDLLPNIAILLVYLLLFQFLLGALTEWPEIIAYYKQTREGFPYLRGLPTCPFLGNVGIQFQCKADVKPTDDPSPITKCHILNEAEECMMGKAPAILKVVLEEAENDRIKQQRILQLRTIGYKEAGSQLLELLNEDENDIIKETIAFCLRDLGNKEVLTKLADHIGQHSKRLDEYAFQSITTLGPEAFPIFEDFILSKDQEKEDIAILAAKELSNIAKKWPDETTKFTKKLLNQEEIDPIIISYLFDVVEQSPDIIFIKETMTPYLNHQDMIVRQTAQHIIDNLEEKEETTLGEAAAEKEKE